MSGGNLVFSRSPGRAFYIGRGVTVTILDVDTETGDVRVSVEAPRWVVVSRDDFPLERHLALQMEREKREGGVAG